jgi:hypothetical protein
MSCSFIACLRDAPFISLWELGRRYYSLHLLDVEIEHFRSIEDQRIPAEGLVVLFGPNSAGKTSVLEAVEELVARAATVRADPGEDDDPYVLGSVTFDVPGAGVAGSKDAQLYRSLLCGEYTGPDMFGNSGDAWAWLREGLSERLKDADLGAAISVLAEALVGSGDAGSITDRQVLARSIFDPDAVYFADGLTSISLNVDGPSLPAKAMDAAERIASATGDDALWKLATGLASAGWVHVAWVGNGGGKARSFAEEFPPVIVLDGDLESLSAELESAIVTIHNRLWDFELEKLSADEVPDGVELFVGERFHIGMRGSSNRYAVDPWLETRSEKGEVIPPGLFDRYDESDWYRVRHSVLATAELIAAEANQAAPDFVKSQGTIGIEVLSVAAWSSAGHRVRATFTEPQGEKRDLGVMGAGTSRWAAAAIRLAAWRLAKGRQIVYDAAGADVVDENERRRIVQEAYHAPFTQTAVRLVPSDSQAVYIADEPEAHLHPAALQSVREWLSRLAETAATVLVATHSSALLDGESELIHRVLVLRTVEVTVLRELTGPLGDELERVSGTLGLTKGDLLLLTRVALFVEGPHDQIILDEWFGEDLRVARVRVFPVHGVDNLTGLVDSEIVAALGIRIATLSDDASVLRAVSGNPRTRGERAIARLVREAERAGAGVHPIGLTQPDILYYLDAEICRRIAPNFPGWSTAVGEWVSSGSRMQWKKWVQQHYSLPLTRESIRELARECRRHDRIPAELKHKVRVLLSYLTLITGSGFGRA